MQRSVLDDVELVVARDRPLLLAFDLDLENGRQEFALINQVVERPMIERDRLRGLAPAIDDARNTTFTANATGGPLAAPATHRGRELLCLGHCDVLLGNLRPRLQGCRKRTRAAYSGREAGFANVSKGQA